ncbi:ribosome biogenesis protein BMS1 homolog isoform X2 [Papaver somniferum]|uniref:ribosome biogenesis protein BMS1 homolog isoform X2 n=1 Tax=Papaver somniferum TaxID=3469 RepID=UPI000E6FC3BF|nr:ribosome biogenesis protein BMS1 homolog isoform X2 [Papaver somniferum]
MAAASASSTHRSLYSFYPYSIGNTAIRSRHRHYFSSPRDRKRKVGDSYIENGVSYIQIYKKMKSCDDEVSANDYRHQDDPDPTVEEERPPYIIGVQGPPRVGKSLLIKSLVSFYTRGNHCDMAGPIRILAGEKRRIQFVECPNNVNGMIDATKYADAVIFVVDAGYGFEMETFEFLELLKVHGMPKVMGVLTYLDTFRNKTMLANTQRILVDQFQTEICKGAQIFCLSGLDNDEMYFNHEIAKLAAYISTMEFRSLSWRDARPYLLVDYFEDVTQETVQLDDENCSRKIILKGYLRGCYIEKTTKVHIAGVGDFPLACVTKLADPFPLPSDGDINELTCMEIGCFRAGTYVSFELHNVPFETVKHYDPCRPVLVGGISLEEENLGYIQVKLKRHSWHTKLLKTKDPIIVSVGWRRYQKRPIYAFKGRHGSYQALNHTPENKPCLAMFWAPLAPLGTGLAVVQSLADKKAAVRFLGKAYVVDINQGSVKIVKKSRRTSLLKDMCTKIHTTTGICGKIDEEIEKEIEEPRPLPKEDRALLLAEFLRRFKEREELKANGTAECQVY